MRAHSCGPGDGGTKAADASSEQREEHGSILSLYEAKKRFLRRVFRLSGGQQFSLDNFVRGRHLRGRSGGQTLALRPT
jgi:hypothetical protein